MTKQKELRKNVLDAQLIKDITEHAIRVYEETREADIQARNDRRLFNVKQLMENYVRISQSIDRMSEVEENEDNVSPEQLMSSGMLLESLNKSRVRSRVMIDHVNKTLEVYKYICQLENCSDRYQILIDRHVHDIKPHILEEKYHISKRTVYRQLDEAYKTLTILMFGIDAMCFEVV